MEIVIENILYSLNVTLPLFLLMLLGYFLRKTNFISESLAGALNRFVFYLALPVMLFYDLAHTNFDLMAGGELFLFCLLATIVSVPLSALLSLLCKDRSVRGEFTQACFRSSAAVIGVAVIKSIYGSAGLAPLMLMATVPFYNLFSAVILLATKQQAKVAGWQSAISLIKEIATNPLIIGIACGVLWAWFELPLPSVIETTLGDIAATATPLALIVTGTAFYHQKLSAALKPTLLASFVKLVGLALLIVPLAILIGFRGEALVAILVMAASSTAPVSYIMSRSMGHEGAVTCKVVTFTTLASAFTLAGWIFLFQNLSLL